MCSLVSYDYSDSEEEENEQEQEQSTTTSIPKVNENIAITTNSKSDTATTNNNISNDIKGSPSFLSSTFSSTSLNKNAIKRTSTGRIQIAAPSLDLLRADSDSDDEEEEERRRRKMQRSDRGSHLISLLPKPKKASSSLSVASSTLPKPNFSAASSTPTPSAKAATSLTSFVPFSVANRAGSSKSTAIKPKTPSTDKKATTASGGSTNFLFANQDNDDDDEDDDDFDDIRIPFEEQLKHEEMIASPSILPAPPLDAPEYGPAKPPPTVEYTDDLYTPTASTVPLDPNQDTTYKKFIASKFGEEQASDIKIVDFDMSKHLSENKEWIKNITIEKGDENDSEIEAHAPNSTARRKNQITFLAYQARKRETELKNEWAQNKVTKMQTRAKYGF